MNVLQLAEQFRRAMQMYAQTLPDEAAMEIATVYPAWASGKEYAAAVIVQYGANEVGDPQLYRCVQSHTSQSDWTPDAAASLWSEVGIGGDGVPVWSRPSGAHDAYDTGDRVHYPEADSPIYESLIDGNTFSPEEYPAGWRMEGNT